jgi:hypothetical protein
VEATLEAVLGTLAGVGLDAAQKKQSPTTRKKIAVPKVNAGSGGSSVPANYVFAGSKVHWVAYVSPARTTPGSIAAGILAIIEPLSVGASGVMNAQLATHYKGQLRAAIEGMGFNVTGIDITGTVNAHATVEAITPIDRNNISDIRGDFTNAARQVGLLVGETDNYIRVISKPANVQGGSDVRQTGNELEFKGNDNNNKDDKSWLEKLGMEELVLGAALVVGGLAVVSFLRD